MELYYNWDITILPLEQNGSLTKAVMFDNKKAELVTLAKSFFQLRKLEVIDNEKGIIKRINDILQTTGVSISNEILERIVALLPDLKRVTSETEEKHYKRIFNYPTRNQEKEIKAFFNCNGLGISKTAKIKSVYEKKLPSLDTALKHMGYNELAQVNDKELITKVYEWYLQKNTIFKDRFYNFKCFYKIRIARRSVLDEANNDILIKLLDTTSLIAMPNYNKIIDQYKRTEKFNFIKQIFVEYVLGICKREKYERLEKLNEYTGGTYMKGGITGFLSNDKVRIARAKINFYTDNLCIDEALKAFSLDKEEWLRKGRGALKQRELMEQIKATAYELIEKTTAVQVCKYLYSLGYLRTQATCPKYPKALHQYFFYTNTNKNLLGNIFKEIEQIAIKRGEICMQ